jgi:hypothetical protein
VEAHQTGLKINEGKGFEISILVDTHLDVYDPLAKRVTVLEKRLNIA